MNAPVGPHVGADVRQLPIVPPVVGGAVMPALNPYYGSIHPAVQQIQLSFHEGHPTANPRLYFPDAAQQIADVRNNVASGE